MIRGFHQICVLAVWLKNMTMKKEKDGALEVLRLTALWLKIQHLKCFALEIKALWSFETSVSITNPHGVTSQKIWNFCWFCFTEMHPVRLFPSPWLKPMSRSNSTSVQWKGTIFIRWGDWKRVGGGRLPLRDSEVVTWRVIALQRPKTILKLGLQLLWQHNFYIWYPSLSVSQWVWLDVVYIGLKLFSDFRNIFVEPEVNTRWFKYDRDRFVCKQAALRSSCATLREWSHNLHPPSCSG